MDAAVADAGTGGDGGPGTFTIHVAATTTTFPHADGYVGQTARNCRGGIRSVSLLRDAQDAEPVELFNLGEDPVEVSYDDGARTLVATVSSRALVAGHFTLVRMVQAYSRYDVDATVHLLGTSTDGTFVDLLVMSNGTRVDGTLHDAGDYEFVFEPVDGEPETYTGEGWPVPIWSSTAGAWAVVENGEWAVYYPADLVVEPSQWAGANLEVLVNMDHAFRWIDNPLGIGYRAGVWDVEWPTAETVMRFGGNQFDVTVTGPGIP